MAQLWLLIFFCLLVMLVCISIKPNEAPRMTLLGASLSLAILASIAIIKIVFKL